ncbi:MAG: response regulator [Bacteroidales bacterium]|nr:response regulator [Bacteroidales bacterium]
MRDEPDDDLIEEAIKSHTHKQKTDKSPVILIVEDNHDMREFLRMNLGSCGEIVEASDGKSGFEMAKEIFPDMIITDIMMPEMDGIELTSLLKQDNDTNHIPVILLTARSSHEAKIQGLDSGADDYICKPFSPDELLRKINNILETRKHFKEKYRKEIILEPKEISVASPEEKFLKKSSLKSLKNMYQTPILT